MDFGDILLMDLRSRGQCTKKGPAGWRILCGFEFLKFTLSNNELNHEQYGNRIH